MTKLIKRRERLSLNWNQRTIERVKLKTLNLRTKGQGEAARETKGVKRESIKFSELLSSPGN